MLGLGVGIVLFVPFVAISYRRRGGLTLWRFLLWAGALVYFWALWTYTLLPLPERDSIRCVGAILDPMTVVEDIQTAFTAGGNPLGHLALQQLLFNVLLFIPLGAFLRILGGRGVVTALFVGFATSAAIEFTQLTGVWGIYPCAYRFFDVGDLMTNTIGAVTGSVLAIAIPRAWRRTEVEGSDVPREVTKPRRFLGMICDLLGYTFLASAVAFAVQIVLGLMGERELVREGTVAEISGFVAAFGVWSVVLLASGRTIGDFCVRIRYEGSPLPAFFARILRYAGGIGGYALLQQLGALPELGVLQTLSQLFALVAFIMLFTTKRGRGLPGILSGQHVSDDRA